MGENWKQIGEKIRKIWKIIEENVGKKFGKNWKQIAKNKKNLGKKIWKKIEEKIGENWKQIGKKWEKKVGAKIQIYCDFDFTLNLFFQWEWSLEVKKDWEDGK